jgi:protoporphyrinogen/coproporphyrinogen III oxidase
MKPGAVDLLVVGAGISGLGLAQMARRYGFNPTIVEASNHIGGAINSCLFTTERGDFWAELGSHTCYNSYGNFLQLLDETDQINNLVPRAKLRYQMQIGNNLHSIPSQLNFLELLGVLPRLWLSSKEGRSVKAYYGGLIGSRNYRQVLGPALDAVVCQPAGDFPADAIFRKKPRRKEIMRSYTGASGLQSFTDGIAAELDIRLNSPVTRIQHMSDRFLVELKDEEPIQAERLALAVAPDVAANLLADEMPELACRLAEIEMAEIESQAVLVRSDQLKLPQLAGIIGLDDDFYSAVSRDLVPDEHFRAFTFHFKPGRLDQMDRITRISQVLGVDEEAMLDSKSCLNRLPALRLGHAERVEFIDQQLKNKSIGLTGNWFSGVSIEDSLVRSHSECLRLCT